MGCCQAEGCLCRSLIASDTLTLSTSEWATALGESIIPLVSSFW